MELEIINKIIDGVICETEDKGSLPIGEAEALLEYYKEELIKEIEEKVRECAKCN